ncbi:hypothetical protein, partial [Escherichia coli]
SGKNIIRWLLKKRTNGSVRYCQYTSGFGVVVDLHCQEAFWLRFWCFVRMFCGSFSLQAFLVVHVVFKSIHAVVACFAAVCRIIFSFRDGLFRFNHS